MIKIETRDTGKPVVPDDIAEAQKAYLAAKEHRRDLFEQAIKEKRTYRWIAEHSGLTPSNVFQLVNKTNYNKGKVKYIK